MLLNTRDVTKTMTLGADGTCDQISSHQSGSAMEFSVIEGGAPSLPIMSSSIVKINAYSSSKQSVEEVAIDLLLHP